MAFHFANINAVYYLLAAVILIVTPVSFVNADPVKDYIVTLKSETGNEAEAHYSWLKEQGKTLYAATSVNDEASSEGDALQTFSIGTWNAYNGQLSENWVEEVLRKRPEVDTIQLNGKVQLFAPITDGKQQPVTVAQTILNNLDMLDATESNPPFDSKFQYPEAAGEGVNVYTVDSGVLETHSQFEGRAKMVAAVCKGCPKTDDMGHGTHVAGTIAGRDVGIAKKANIFAIKAFDAGGQGETADILKAYEMVADAKKANKKGIFVVNYSAGSGPDDAIDKAAKALTDVGVHVVVAAGNEGQDACQVSPAREPSVITVGALQDYAFTNAYFSNWGTCVDIFAPGVDVLSCGFTNDYDKAVMDGTSMATPHVVGVAALYLSKNGDLPPAELQAALKDKALKDQIKFSPGTEKSPNLIVNTRNL